MSFRRRSLAIGLACLLFGVSDTWAGPKDPIRGEGFTRLITTSQPGLQAELAKFFPDSEGYLVTGPLGFGYGRSHVDSVLFGRVRVLIPDLNSFITAVDRVQSIRQFASVEVHLETGDPVLLGFRGAVASLEGAGEYQSVLFLTTNQLRWLIWMRDIGQLIPEQSGIEGVRLAEYQTAVSDYLHAVDRGDIDHVSPKASEYGLPESRDLYPPPPPYVIEGYDNYKDLLQAHETINTDFGHGITAFVPSDSLLQALKQRPPAVAYPNKEAPLLQHEYRKFFERGGDVRIMQTLTAEVLDTLQPGEYFYAVGITGEIRFGQELLREEVERIETETGRKVPRANHAFLFPGEPVLTAGAFFVEMAQVSNKEHRPRIAEVNTHSGHYFYSNVTQSIRDDIAVHSNEYLLSIGHFLRALDALGISTERILISKM